MEPTPGTGTEVKRDVILVVDLEATCWRRDPPPGQQSEIIEIGICALPLERLTPERKRGIIVKPTRSKVSEFCTSLTSITPEMADGGVTFAEACASIREGYNAQDYLWTSWGGYDERMLRQQCESFGVTNPFGQHMNLKQVYADLRNKGRRRGMARILQVEELGMEGRHHRGEDDAWNTARILAKLIKEDGQDFLEPFWKEPTTE